jgi:hypothetical protein
MSKAVGFWHIIDSALIYIMMVEIKKLKYYLSPSMPQILLHRRAGLWTISKGTQSVFSR